MTAPLNRNRFVKLIALAESNHDGEALSAVRKAASMARAAGMSLGEAVGTSGPETSASFTDQFELTLARMRIAALERKLCSGANEAQLEAEHIKGYVAGHKAGKDEGRREVEIAANNRVREIEAQLEAYRPVLDWLPIAELFAHKNQRGTRVGFARAVLLRAGTNKLTPTDQAELRKFAKRYPSKFPPAPRAPIPEPVPVAHPSKMDTPATVAALICAEIPTEAPPVQSGHPTRASDRRAHALALLSNLDTAGWSDRAIAQAAGVSPSTVGKLRRECGDVSNLDSGEIGR